MQQANQQQIQAQNVQQIQVQNVQYIQALNDAYKNVDEWCKCIKVTFGEKKMFLPPDMVKSVLSSLISISKSKLALLRDDEVNIIKSLGTELANCINNNQHLPEWLVDIINQTSTQDKNFTSSFKKMKKKIKKYKSIRIISRLLWALSSLLTTWISLLNPIRLLVISGAGITMSPFLCASIIVGCGLIAAALVSSYIRKALMYPIISLRKENVYNSVHFPLFSDIIAANKVLQNKGKGLSFIEKSWPLLLLVIGGITATVIIKTFAPPIIAPIIEFAAKNGLMTFKNMRLIKNFLSYKYVSQTISFVIGATLTTMINGFFKEKDQRLHEKDINAWRKKSGGFLDQCKDYQQNLLQQQQIQQQQIQHM